MLYQAGHLSAEERAFRRVARNHINDALHTLDARLQRLADSAIQQLNPGQASQTRPADLLADMLCAPGLSAANAVIERYTDAFPELSPEAARARASLCRRTLHRLAEALEPFHRQRRFSCTRSYRRH